MATKAFSKIAVLLETFFTDHLMTQRQVSQHTIASYRDTFRLLLEFAQRELHKPPAVLTIDDISVSFVKRFLFHLESTRAVSARNAQSAAGGHSLLLPFRSALSSGEESPHPASAGTTE